MMQCNFYHGLKLFESHVFFTHACRASFGLNMITRTLHVHLYPTLLMSFSLRKIYPISPPLPDHPYGGVKDAYVAYKTGHCDFPIIVTWS